MSRSEIKWGKKEARGHVRNKSGHIISNTGLIKVENLHLSKKRPNKIFEGMKFKKKWNPLSFYVDIPLTMFLFFHSFMYFYYCVKN